MRASRAFIGCLFLWSIGTGCQRADALAVQEPRAAARAALRPFAKMTDRGEIEYAGRLSDADAARALYRFLVGVNHIHTPCGIVYASEIYDLAVSASKALGGENVAD